MIALVATAGGTFAVDLETDEVAPAEPFEPSRPRAWSRAPVMPIFPLGTKLGIGITRSATLYGLVISSPSRSCSLVILSTSSVTT